MPWSHCNETKIPDTEPCPGCGFKKDIWTVQWEATRTLVIAGPKAKPPKLRFLLKDWHGVLVASEQFTVTQPEGDEVRDSTSKRGVGGAEVSSGPVILEFPDRVPGEIEGPDGDAVQALDNKKGVASFSCVPNRGMRYDLRVKPKPSWVEFKIVEQLDESVTKPCERFSVTVRRSDGKLFDPVETDDTGLARVEVSDGVEGTWEIMEISFADRDDRAVLVQSNGGAE
jgi:hypothetical protein